MQENRTRKYNQLVADETIEDYSLRYAPKAFRKWSELLIANTALGSISFLALEAIGATIAIHYGFITAFWAILTASLIIFVTAIPISYYAAKYNMDIDLITRSAGFGYVGSTFTSLIYASFSFIFFALEASIMAQALELYFGLPLAWGYLLCSVVIIPMVFYGITFINKLQLWTQPIWIIMMVLPFIAVLLKEPNTIEAFTSFTGEISGSSEFSIYYFGFAVGISLAMIAQIGEQVDYLRFMPELEKNNRVKWWLSVFIAGPGWIILGFLKQIGGIFLAALVLLTGLSIYEAKTPVEMYYAAYKYIFDNPSIALAAATFFVVVSQIKINVTNAYAGSLAWSNFFARVTYSHPGRVVWMVFNIAIALLLMELGLFDVLENVLGLYSNVAIAWIGAIFSDLVINKPLGLSPKIVEFKRAYLYNVNPVGVGSMGIASVTAIIAFMGFFGDLAQSYSSIIAMFLAVILSPLIAWLTKGKYYIARGNLFAQMEKHTYHTCKTCAHEYDTEDMVYCPLVDNSMCSLCCSLDSLCHDICKAETGKTFRQKVADSLSKLLKNKISSKNSLKVLDFILINAFLSFTIIIAGWMTLAMQLDSIPLESQDIFRKAIFNFSVVIAMLMSILSLWIILLQDSSTRAEALLASQNLDLKDAKIRSENITHELEKELELSEKKDKQLFQQTRLAQMGEMLAMIAHQWRQPLSAITSKSSNLQMKSSLKNFDLSNKADAQKYELLVNSSLRSIDNYVTSLSQTIDDFRNFYRPNKKKVRKTLDEVLLKSLEIITESLVQDNIEIIREHHSKEEIELYDSELMQVVLNILKNSQDNFKEKGIKNPYINIVTGDRSISISDNGGGVPEDIKDQIFNPYFSTKDEKNGTGLGLYMSKIIVEDHHNGSFRMENRGDGVCFIIECGAY